MPPKFHEFSLRFESSISNQLQFYTDLQGFQMKKSLHRPDRPIGFNFFPITSQAFIQDSVFVSFSPSSLFLSSIIT